MVLLNSIFKEIFSAFRSNALVYSNPFVVIQSVAYFLIFDTLKLQSKFINKIAGTVIGVYLIHDNSLVRKTLYKFLRIDNGPITSYTFLIHILLVALLILVVCVIIETLRKTIFKFIYNWKISRCIRERYYKFCDEFFKSRKVFDV